MHRPLFRPTTLMLAGLMATAAIPQAYAQDAEAVAERLKEVLALQQVELDYEAARASGDDVVLEGVTASGTDVEGSIDLGEITLQDVSEEADGAFRIETVAVDAYTHEDDSVSVAMEDIVLTGIVLPADLESDPFGGMLRYDRMEVGGIDVETENGNVATIEDMYSDLVISDDQSVADTTMTIDSFRLDLGALTESGSGAARLEELGYDEISGRMELEGSWQPSDGRMTMSRFDTHVEEAGLLSVTVDFAGYTPDFIETLQRTAESMERQGSGEDKSMQGMAMLGLMQQLTFHGASIRFEDESLTGKVLEATASQQGTSPEAVISQTQAAIPAQLSPFLGDELAGEVSDAVGAFLEDPQNIEISAQPEEPVPFAMLMAAAMGSPEILVRQIGLTIRANQ